MIKNVLITGASRGIGKAIALYFAKKGFNVAITCRTNNKLLIKVKNTIESYGVSCIEFVTDLGNFNTTKNNINYVLKKWGKIDILINNAGISYIGLLTDMSVEDWNYVINTNITSVFNTCKLIVPNMVTKKSGKIINISSVWGEVGASCEVAYSTSKGGLNTFTKALAKELALSNIQVNAISCGPINTTMNDFLSPEEKIQLTQEIPLGRMGTPEDVAKLAYFLSSDESNYLTGKIIKLDGGWI
ncbi:MAG: elongation factor P 5-aminopentanone reductase [Eubacteriales bacterium]